MALIACKECGNEISTEAAACPKCGAPVAKPPAPKKPRLWLWIPLGAFAAFMAFGFAISSSPEAQEKAKLRRAIDLCWDEQKRKSLSPGEAQFIAGACERMERDFENKYHVRP